MILKPYHLLTSPVDTGTNHGTPHDYDTHVPLLVFGADVRPGVRKMLVTPQTATAVLAHALRVKPPTGAEAAIPEALFRPIVP